MLEIECRYRPSQCRKCQFLDNMFIVWKAETWGQIPEVTCPVIGGAQPELTPSKRQKMGPGSSVAQLGFQTGIR